jgi:hypothetical protein
MKNSSYTVEKSKDIEIIYNDAGVRYKEYNEEKISIMMILPECIESNISIDPSTTK